MAEKRSRKKVTMEILPKGTTIQDVSKAQWRIEEPIGQGGFGVIYSITSLSPKNEKSSSAYVAKVEPHSNGPLFVEKNFFMRNLQPDMLNDYKQKNKLQFLGLPEYIGGGSYTHKNVQHRFLIMERFGDSISKKFTSSIPDYKLLGNFCSQIVDSLMYIHDKGYAHMDVKPENLLLKYKCTSNQIYLIDFGIVDRFTTEKEFKPDKKKQHNGTVLYTSQDSHQGVITRRGDFEVLGYNILQWCGIELPWIKDVKNPNLIFEKKTQFLSNLKNNLTGKVPENVIKYFDYVNNMSHDESPNYPYIKSLLQNLASTTIKKASKRNTVTNDDTRAENSPEISREVAKKPKEKISVETEKSVIMNAAMKAVINNRKNALMNGNVKTSKISHGDASRRKGRAKKS